MNSKAYSAKFVNDVSISGFVRGREGRAVWVGIDVGKYDLYVVLCWGPEEFERPWRVASPFQIPLLVERLRELSKGRSMIVAMEPSGTYGDALAQALHDAKLTPHRVTPKIAHDFAEVFDAVPSQHDGKDAAVVAELCRLGRSRLYPAPLQDPIAQEIAYWVDRLETHRRLRQVWTGRLEARLARHWPELAQQLKRTSPTLLKLLMHYGDPSQLASDPKAKDRLRPWGRRPLQDQRIEQILAGARSSVGVRMNPFERLRLRQIAKQAWRQRQALQRATKRLTALSAGKASITSMSRAVGVTTACVLWTIVGEPSDYRCAAAYVKAMGLNLAERSSGTHKGRLKISKRGSATVRYVLYLAALRLTKQASVKTWYLKKKQREQNHGGLAPGGKAPGGKALVGIMRRLATALWHVGTTGKPFEAPRLFPGTNRTAHHPGSAPQPVRGGARP